MCTTHAITRSHIANPDSAARWKDILAIADMFSMDEIARVATYALDYNIGLSDIRKISLTFRRGLDMTWATESIKSVCLRDEPLSRAEACTLELDLAIGIAEAREMLNRRRSHCKRCSRVRDIKLS